MKAKPKRKSNLSVEDELRIELASVYHRLNVRGETCRHLRSLRKILPPYYVWCTRCGAYKHHGRWQKPENLKEMNRGKDQAV